MDRPLAHLELRGLFRRAAILMVLGAYMSFLGQGLNPLQMMILMDLPDSVDMAPRLQREFLLLVLATRLIIDLAETMAQSQLLCRRIVVNLQALSIMTDQILLGGNTFQGSAGLVLDVVRLLEVNHIISYKKRL